MTNWVISVITLIKIFFKLFIDEPIFVYGFLQYLIFVVYTNFCSLSIYIYYDKMYLFDDTFIFFFYYV